jgi:glycosyltransferase involved in cell wall biosynthesis
MDVVLPINDVAEVEKESAPPPKISLVIYLPSLDGGGAERIHINLAPLLIANRFDVTFLIQRIAGPLVEAVPPGVRVVSLECSHTLNTLQPLVRFLKKEQPDILLSNLGHTNIMAIWAVVLARVRTRIVVTQHNCLSSECANRGWRFTVLPLLYRLFLWRAHGIIAVSQGVADDLTKVTGIKRDRIMVIYNPIVTRDFQSRMEETAVHPWLVNGGPPIVLGVGRLNRQKEFETLISAFALVTQKCDARLILLGEGPLRASLEAHVEALGIGDRVSMPGFQQNPLPFMRKAAVLALTSRYEGFGNVLVEALACGTPVVSTDCPYGPSEILGNGRFGRLVPVADTEAMANAIIETIRNPPASDILRQRGREFTAETAAIWYTDLFYILHYI